MQPAIGLVVALNAEAIALIGRGPWRQGDVCLFRRSHLTRDTPLLIARSGIGMRQAGSAAEWLVREGVFALGVSGISGGLSPDLGPGDLIVADAVLKEGNGYNLVWKGDRRLADLTSSALRAKGLSPYCGAIMTVHEPVFSVRKKEALYNESRALAVDMESAAVAAVARNAGLPFFAIRSVCDPCTVSVPEALSECLDPRGRVRPFHLLRRLMLSPRLLLDLGPMKGYFSMALNGLRQAWCNQVKEGLAAWLLTSRNAHIQSLDRTAPVR